MATLSSPRLRALALPISTSWLLADCMEARGKQELWLRQKPELIRTLRETALIESVESSNRIEGVTVSADRLRPIVLRRAVPRDRPEEELAGYRRALDWIFSRKRAVNVSATAIRHLHQVAQRGASDAGRFKTRDNEIVELLPTGGRRVRFRPTGALQTPAAIDALCAAYQRVTGAGELPALLALSTFVFDLLCIHPFRDGNGRVSRLVTILLLQQAGFEVARHVSIERLIEERKQEYYRVLETCSKGWDEDKNEIVPWWNFMLAIVRAAFAELEGQVAGASLRGQKTALIQRVILSKPDSFTLGEIVADVPSASPALVRKVLLHLKSAGRIRLEGRGRGAVWKRADP